MVIESTPTTSIKAYMPPQYQHHTRVFDEKELKKFLPKRLWDHAIKLKQGALVTLISQNIRLS